MKMGRNHRKMRKRPLELRRILDVSPSELAGMNEYIGNKVDIKNGGIKLTQSDAVFC